MQQRVALVRAFALGAPLLLMDEPFAALDEITRADMRHLLARLCEPLATTVLFVTHSIAEPCSSPTASPCCRPGRAGSSASSRSTSPAPAGPSSRTTRRSSPSRPACGRCSRAGDAAADAVTPRRIVARRASPASPCSALFWELLVRLFDVRPFVLLPPSRIVERAGRPTRASTWRRPLSPPATPLPGIAIALVVAVADRRRCWRRPGSSSRPPSRCSSDPRRPVGRLLHLDRAVARQWRPARHLPRRLRDDRRRSSSPPSPGCARPTRPLASCWPRSTPAGARCCGGCASRPRCRHPRRGALRHRPGPRRGVLRRGRQPDNGGPRRGRTAGRTLKRPRCCGRPSWPPSLLGASGSSA